MADWGICTTIKAPLAEVEAFVAYHLSIGVAHIWLHFDDPADPAAAAFEGHPQLTIIRCDEAYWINLLGSRPDAHQPRQAANMKRVYDAAPLEWLVHIDVDEFIYTDESIGSVLDTASDCMVRMRPWEAVHSPKGLPVFDANLFRAPLKGKDLRQRWRQSCRQFAPALRKGALSHVAGKSFFRTGRDDLEPRIHGAWVDGQQLRGIPFHDGIKLLHFHAQNRADWIARLPYRLEHGGYRGNEEMKRHLDGASVEDIAAFYDQVMTIKPWLALKLAEENLLIEANLDLPAKVAAFRQP